MKRRPQPAFLMPDVGAGFPPADSENSSIRWPRIRRVVAENHPIELRDGDPVLDDLVKLIGHQGMKEFGQFVDGGFRMIELLGLIDHPDDQLPQGVVDNLGLNVSVLPLVSTRIKLLTNALVAVALRSLGATIHGPFEEPVFLHPQDRASLQGLAKMMLANPGVQEVLEGYVWWSEVPPVELDISDPDAMWGGYIPEPEYIVYLFRS